jgi:hypothetical protein
LDFTFQRRNETQEVLNAADVSNWEKKNTKAMKNIFGAIKEDQSRILMSCGTTQEMWLKLETEYGEASSESAPRLWTKFYGCKFQRGQNLTAFLTELEKTVSRLRSLNVVIEDNKIIAKILLTIPAELQIFEVAWDITPEADKTLKNFTSRLIKLDKNIKMRKLLPS